MILAGRTMQLWLRGLMTLGAACTIGCNWSPTETYPSVSVDTSTAAGWLADGTFFLASSGVFGGGGADDGSRTVPPLDAVFEMKGRSSTDVVEIRALVSYALAPRAPSDVLVCAIIDRASDVAERCDKPEIDVQLEVDSSSCVYSPCLVDVAGRLTITGSAVFNGTVVFDHEEQWATMATGGDTPIL
jgi:hypothetical protein